MRVGVNVGVLYELVCVVVDGVGVPGGHGGRVCCYHDGCGSVGRILGPLVVAPKSFAFGPFVAATHRGSWTYARSRTVLYARAMSVPRSLFNI